MNKEDYKILKEIGALTTQNKKNHELIQVEEQRLDKINELRAKRESQKDKDQTLLKEKRLQLQDIENKIAHEGQALEKSKSQLSMLIDANEISSLTKQIETKEENLDQLENQGLELLEEVENLENEIKTAETFLEGSLETIDEINIEIKEISDPLLQKIKLNDERIESLFSELPENVTSKTKKLLEKDLKYGPFTIINNGSCNICGYAVDKVQQDKIEIKLEFKSCQACSRIFIPMTGQY